jgi:hypothetical protein
MTQFKFNDDFKSYINLKWCKENEKNDSQHYSYIMKEDTSLFIHIHYIYVLVKSIDF